MVQKVQGQGKSQRVRAPEIPLTRVFILLFTLLVIAGLYYEFGGPVPYYVHFDGPAGVSFEGRYAALTGDEATLPEAAATLRGTYPQTVTLWGPRWQGVIATLKVSGDANVLSTLSIKRAWVTCSEAYRWGTEMSVVCPTQ